MLSAYVVPVNAQDAQPSCPKLLQHSLKRLHAPDVVDLCQHYQGKPLLIVNTASHCGFTPQFTGLEALYQKYKDQGLIVLGFPSNDFNQEASNEEKTASICYKNFGVTFDMFTPVSVKGSKAHPVFQFIGQHSESPRWNFFKYLVDTQGQVVASFPSKVKPSDPALEQAIQNLLSNNE